MNAQNIISHRMFVAALNHDGNEESRTRRPNHSAAAVAHSSPGLRTNGAPVGKAVQQLLLLTDGIELKRAQSGL
jgi:hypothetical protein